MSDFKQCFGCIADERIEKLEQSLKVLRVWAKIGELDCKKVLRLCNGVLPKLIHEMPGVKRKRLVDLGG